MNITRGFEWYEFLNKDTKNKLSEKDLIWAKYPSDEEILKVGVKGIYIGNFFKWDGKNAELMKKIFMERSKIRERTYRRFLNLTMNENGVHDLMKFIKFGMEDAQIMLLKILEMHMKRSRGVELVKKYDHIISKT